MATLTVGTLDRSLQTEDDLLTAAAAGGDDWVNSGLELLELKNDSGGVITVTIVTFGTQDGLAIADLAIAVPANKSAKLGPFKNSIYANPADNKISMTYSTEVSLSVGVYKLGTV